MTTNSAARSRTSTTYRRSGLAGAIFGALFLKRFVTDTRALGAHRPVRMESQGASRPQRRGRSAGVARRPSLLMARYGVAR